MLTVQQALTAVLEQVSPFEPSAVPLFDSLGLVIAEDIISNVDSPPFDKALMDGFAVRAADVADGRATLTLIEEITAGQVPHQPVASGQATQIMTGAPIPPGADAVVRVEDAETAHGENADNVVKIDTQPMRPGVNMMKQGTSMQRGDRVLAAGRLLRPQELGALAEMGIHQVRVRRRPRVGVLATGDELVPIATTPGPGQIRNSNETMLAAQIRRAGAEPVPLGIARDERRHLHERIIAGLDCDVLLLSGGVSAGKRDLVPSQLEAAGVQQVFHKVRVKPGKPLWFGTCRDRSKVDGNPNTQSESQLDRHQEVASNGRRYVFGLPGNPVSSMVCFELFVRTALRRLMGVEPARPTAFRARLTMAHTARGDRPTYFPAHLEWTPAGPRVTTVEWQGSADLRATVEANGMAVFPAGDQCYLADEEIDVICWD